MTDLDKKEKRRRIVEAKVLALLKLFVERFASMLSRSTRGSVVVGLIVLTEHCCGLPMPSLSFLWVLEWLTAELCWGRMKYRNRFDHDGLRASCQDSDSPIVRRQIAR